MKIGIPTETHSNEPRVAATPDSVRKLVALGTTCLVQSGAGSSAYYLDEEYQEAGATIQIERPHLAVTSYSRCAALQRKRLR